VHPAYDVLLIGGGLSVLAFIAIAATGVTLLGSGGQGQAMQRLALVVFLANSAHFASSTVRLYTKRDSFEEHRFLTMGLPLVCVGVLGLCLALPELFGRHLWALYLTWAPFHYSAQAFGIASLYCRRAGCDLDPVQRRWLRAVCLLPFFFAILGTSPAMGLAWLVPPEWISGVPGLPKLLNALRWVLSVATFAIPVLLFAALARGERPGMPLISLLAVLANGLWWIGFSALEAFGWATIFHGIQYLALVIVFHVKERAARPGDSSSPSFHALSFYAASLLLAYALFQLWPYTAWTLGFGWAESVILVVAIINLHHFIVDAYIWRFRPSDSNRRVIEQIPPPAAGAL
jgi:hypothetical protein